MSNQESEIGRHLSERMKAAASLVPAGMRLCDVGTDHGWVPVWLVLRGTVPAALAMDIREGPLSRAAAHIRETGLSDRIRVRLSDGMQALCPGEADGAMIAGMGGKMTCHILKDAEETGVLRTLSFLVLQPQKDIHLVRRWLAEHGWRIDDESIVLEDGKFYPMMRALPGTMQLTLPEELYGPVLLSRMDPVFRQYLLRRRRTVRKILSGLDGDRDPERRRIFEEENRILSDYFKKLNQDTTDGDMHAIR